MSGYYRRGRPARSTMPPLTPPAELVGRLVTWQPKLSSGARRPAVFGTCLSFDPEARTVTIEVQQETSMWQPNPTRTVTLPLSSGPFRPV